MHTGQATNGASSLSHMIYQKLRHEITLLHLMPGSKLSEVKLAEKFNCSRIPVREALHLLAAEDAIELKPQRGSFVTFIDVEQLQRIRYLREALESKVVIDGFKANCFDSIIPYLDSLVIRQQEAVETGAFEIAFHLDREFHRIFYDLTGKEFVLDYTGDRDIHYLRARLLSIQLESPIVMPTQHKLIVQSIKQKDESALQKALHEHLVNVNNLFTSDRQELFYYIKQP